MEENKKIIKLSLATKIQYGLFNFFAPIAGSLIIICSEDFFNIGGTIFALFCIFIGFICFVVNAFNYRKFLVIDDNSLTLCRGSLSHPKVLNMVKLSEINPESKINLHSGYFVGRLALEYDNKKVKLFHTRPSIIGLLLFLGPLEFIMAFKLIFANMNIAWQIKDILPQISYISNKKFEGANAMSVLADVLMWLFVIFITGLGMLGTLLAPFYMFIK